MQVNDADVANVKNSIEVSLAAFAKPATAVRPKLTVQGISGDRQELLHTLMDTYVKNDVLSIQQSIVNRERRGGRGWAGPLVECNRVLVPRLLLHSGCSWGDSAFAGTRSQLRWCCPANMRCMRLRLPAAAGHLLACPGLRCPPTCQPVCADVEYTLARSRYKFDDLEAYMATAYSVRDRLIEEWNDTQCVGWGTAVVGLPAGCRPACSLLAARRRVDCSCFRVVWAGCLRLRLLPTASCASFARRRTFIKEVDPKRVYYLSMVCWLGGAAALPEASA